MKKTVRLFVWIFAAGLLAVAVGFIISLNSRLSRYRQAYEIGYRRAFSELVGSVANIDADLSKGVYVQSPSMLVTLSTDIYRHAEAAKSALSVLPMYRLHARPISSRRPEIFLLRWRVLPPAATRSPQMTEKICAC